MENLTKHLGLNIWNKNKVSQFYKKTNGKIFFDKIVFQFLVQSSSKKTFQLVYAFCMKNSILHQNNTKQEGIIAAPGSSIRFKYPNE